MGLVLKSNLEITIPEMLQASQNVAARHPVAVGRGGPGKFARFQRIEIVQTVQLVREAVVLGRTATAEPAALQIRVGADHVLVVVVGPEHDPVDPCRDQADQLGRILHVVQHPAGDADIERLVGVAQVFDEIAKPELDPLKLQNLLGDQALHVGPRVRLDGRYTGRTLLLQHVAVPPFEGPQLEHPGAGESADAPAGPVDPRILEQRHGATGQVVMRRRKARQPFAAEQVDEVLRRRVAGDVLFDDIHQRFWSGCQVLLGVCVQRHVDTVVLGQIRADNRVIQQ